MDQICWPLEYQSRTMSPQQATGIPTNPHPIVWLPTTTSWFGGISLTEHHGRSTCRTVEYFAILHMTTVLVLANCVQCYRQKSRGPENDIATTRCLEFKIRHESGPHSEITHEDCCAPIRPVAIRYGSILTSLESIRYRGTCIHTYRTY